MKLNLAISGILFLISTLSLEAQNGLVGYWSFDKMDGDIFFDQSKFKNHGANNGAEPVAGVKGNALKFDGVNEYAAIGDEYISTPEVLQDLGEGSISIWFKVEHIPQENGIAPIFYYGASMMCDFFDAANQGMIIEVGHSPIHYRSD